LGTNVAKDNGKTKYQGWKVVRKVAKITVNKDSKKDHMKNFSQLIFLFVLSKNSRAINKGKMAPVENLIPMENILLAKDNIFFFCKNR
jgi:hypothetical protein